MVKIQAFYDNLEVQVDKAFHDVDDTKTILNDEVTQIGLLKVDAENTGNFIDLDEFPDIRDTLIESGLGVINKCKEYRQHHAEQNKH